MENKRENIEQIIHDNLDYLNSSEPSEGHFERFEAKLNKQSKTNKFSFQVVWKVAAAIVFVFLAVNQAFIYFGNHTADITSLSSVSPEYSEVESYYTNAINVGLNQWASLNDAGMLTEEENDMMQAELDDFNVLYKNLQGELKANPYDERVINAMLEYYQAKLNIINMIVTKIQDIKLENNRDEKIEI